MSGRTEGEGDRAEQGWGFWDSLGLEWVPGTRRGWARSSRCLHLPGGNTGTRAPGNCPCTGQAPSSTPRWRLAGDAGDASLGGEPLAGSHRPVPAHPLRTPQEGGGRPSPGAALRSLGVSLAEAPATRPEAPPAPPERGTSGSSPGMTSRCGHSPAEGGCCSPGSIRQLCQDLCRGAETQCDPQRGGSLRAALHCSPAPALRDCRRLSKGRLWAALCPGQA